MQESVQEPPRETDQAAAIAYLEDPQNHGGAQVQRFETHAALVFVAGGRAYKIKRAVRYPYLDFSTLARREAALRRELALNRRTAPELYIGLHALTRGDDGRLALSEAPAAPDRLVEWVLVMRAFEQEALLDSLAGKGALDDALVLALAEAVIAAHRGAEIVRPGQPHRGGRAGVAQIAAENEVDFAARPDLFAAEDLATLRGCTAEAIARLGPLLDRRLAEGKVRRCHGDLHLRNICLVEGRPRLFDALEFDEAMASIDRFYDLAFLLMDLERRGLRAQANLLLNRYLQAGEETEALAALPLFLSLRAAIRAKVAAATEAADRDPGHQRRLRGEARDTFAAALAYLQPPQSCLLAVGGLSGSGKSCLARRLAPGLGPAPGALLLRSDVLRKQLHGVAETEPLPPAAYSEAATLRVYEALRRHAAEALAAGHAVILDAVHARPEERAAAEALARERGLPFLGLWLEAPAEVLAARAEARRGDASDATPAVIRRQLDYDLGAMTWTRVDASGRPDEVAAEARAVLERALPSALAPVDRP